MSLKTWQCPKDWYHAPEMIHASDNMMFCLICGPAEKWHSTRKHWFRRCNASGKWIWPGQKMFSGVVSIRHVIGEHGGGYAIAWLNEAQFLVQKLKGNI